MKFSRKSPEYVIVKSHESWFRVGDKGYLTMISWDNGRSFVYAMLKADGRVICHCIDSFEFDGVIVLEKTGKKIDFPVERFMIRR